MWNRFWPVRSGQHVLAAGPMLADNRAARLLRQLGVNRNEIGPDRAWRCQMASGGVSPAPDPPARAEIVHQSEDTRVTRLSRRGS